MDLAALKVFLTVAQERSFSRAAAKVHRTQPAVSQAVRRLELELGEAVCSSAQTRPRCTPSCR